MASSNRILVKLQPNFGIAAAASGANLRPLYDRPPELNAFGMAVTPQWYLADIPDTDGPNPWDLAHARVADQLGLDQSAVLFAEPDLDQTFNDGSEQSANKVAALAATPPPGAHIPQDPNNNKVTGPFGGPPKFGWHLEDDYSQLKSARDSVQFSDPRTRIAHIDTGYDRTHSARPNHVILEHSFVEGDPDPNKAESRAALALLPENLDHGTGTIGILAGGRVTFLNGDFLGGAPEAEIVTLRIADSVILFKTSAFAQALQFAIDHRCDVVSISMGGLPSNTWSDLVNKAYESGICICAAAGNNIAIGGVPTPTRHVVYPARYHRVLAVCGVMANGQPYYNISGRQLEGNWGPDSCMTEAIAAYTPNIPWPMFKQDPEIRENGEGTSAATPQIAAAAALWLEKYKDSLKRDWRRVEAVRQALFSSAKAQKADPEHFGHGILQARNALSVQPDLNRPQTPPDNDSFAFLRVLTGLGITEPPPREVMFNLELTQRYLANAELQKIIPDPEAQVGDKQLRAFMDAIIEDGGASLALRKHIADRYSAVVGGAVRKAPPEIVPALRPVSEKEIQIANPPFRRIHTYAVDPNFSTQLETAAFNDVVLKVRWESLEQREKAAPTKSGTRVQTAAEPGPHQFIGEYLKVEDTDVSGKIYPLVNLNDSKLLAQDGWPPSEGNPQFHQQMVYAVAMKTIEHFERALGRRVLWRTKSNSANKRAAPQFVPQLVIKPHALQQANAYYSPDEVALLFGYFNASADDPGDHVPGSRVYACLSHDIVAHETTHAILDGMHRRFNEPTNLDVLAFHEAFADVVALMQHFTIPEILENVITRTRGDLESESILGQLAVQFGRAVGGRGALRDAIGTFDKNGKWIRSKPNPADYAKTKEPHARGALLVATIFDAFLAIYKTRTADLLRIYTGGTGVLPAGAIHPDLVRRLANESAKTAGHLLNMCIRTLDYLPPVDITFGEYLRGLITADADLVEDDRYNYRVAFVESFRKRGIYPLNLDTLSVDTLRWQGVDLFEPVKKHPQIEKRLQEILEQLKLYANACFYLKDREDLYETTLDQQKKLEQKLKAILAGLPKPAARDFAILIGLDGSLPFEVCEMRRSMRVGPDGQYKPQIIIALSQSRPMEIDGAGNKHMFLGGATLIVDLAKGAVQYTIGKRIDSEARIDGQTREQRTAAFLKQTLADPLQALLLAPKREPFAALHSLAGLVDN
jgi:hypothetical protein